MLDNVLVAFFDTMCYTELDLKRKIFCVYYICARNSGPLFPVSDKGQIPLICPYFFAIMRKYLTIFRWRTLYEIIFYQIQRGFVYTGHTSLIYLQSNYFDVVKLDGSLVKSILTSTTNQKIVSSVVDLGCFWYQGYLYSPAIPFEKFLTYLKEHQ